MLPLSVVKPRDMAISAKIPNFAAILHRSNPRFIVPQKPPSLFTTSPRLFFSSNISIERISGAKEPLFATTSPSSLQSVEELPPKLQEIINLFSGVQDPKAKYEQLLFYGKNLEPLDSLYKTSDNKVQGCVSQVWVRAYLDNDKTVIFEADSDSVLTKGFAALLVRGLSGQPLEQIVKVSPDFVVLLGLQKSLTPSRNNGFLNMLKMMQKKALQLYVESESDRTENSKSDPSEESSSDTSKLTPNGDQKVSETALSKEENLGNASELRSRGMRIKEKLEINLKPIALEVEDISYQHAHHAAVKGSDGETHFNVKVISEEFEGKNLIKRHRLIYSLLQDELQSGLHALSIEAKTPGEIETQ